MLLYEVNALLSEQDELHHFLNNRPVLLYKLSLLLDNLKLIGRSLQLHEAVPEIVLIEQWNAFGGSDQLEPDHHRDHLLVEELFWLLRFDAPGVLMRRYSRLLL